MKLQPTSEFKGVKFFDDASSCISNYENSHWSNKTFSLAKSFGTFFFHLLNKMNRSLRSMDPQIDPLTKPSRNLSKKRLVVCIHGLNNTPLQFKKIIDEIQKKDLSETDLYLPSVLKKGNAKLDEMVKPILQEITRWAQTSGEKELVLVGISNGARISRAIEAKLAKKTSTSNLKKLHLVSIVGACKGSAVAGLANQLGLSWLMSKNIAEEMPTDSSSNHRLNQKWEKGLSCGPQREYTFIASPHDWQVSNYDSTLMNVKKHNARYAIVPGHGHNSIVNAVAESVAEVILK
ncbi:MAG: hypothetical protein K2P51_01435 [Rhabdochlamydiaceae bacterium]|nr:hypothetical protein [Rhabdochlamydiaceae bacterium]